VQAALPLERRRAYCCKKLPSDTAQSAAKATYDPQGVT